MVLEKLKAKKKSSEKEPDESQKLSDDVFDAIKDDDKEAFHSALKDFVQHCYNSEEDYEEEGDE